MGRTAYDDALSVGAVGTTVTSAAASESTTIPNDASGNRARVVLLSATAPLYVKFGVGATTCTGNDLMVTAGKPILVNCKQYDTIAYIWETSAAKLNITPIET